jgi:hypothetical protein
MWLRAQVGLAPRSMSSYSNLSMSPQLPRPGWPSPFPVAQGLHLRASPCYILPSYSPKFPSLYPCPTSIGLTALSWPPHTHLELPVARPALIS